MRFKLVEKIVLNEVDDPLGAINNIDTSKLTATKGEEPSVPNNNNTKDNVNNKNVEKGLKQASKNQQEEIEAELKKDPKDRKKLKNGEIPLTTEELIQNARLFDQNAIKNLKDLLIYNITYNKLHFESDVKNWNKNDILTYAKNIKGFQPSSTVATLLNKNLIKGILNLNTTSWIYNPLAYNTSDYKFKSLLFYEDKSQINSYGNRNTYPLQEILDSTSEDEIRNLIDTWQVESENKPTLHSIFEVKNIQNKLNEQIKFINNLFKNDKDEDKEIITNLLNLLSKDNKISKNFQNLEIPNWQRDKDDLIKPVVLKFAKEELGEKEKQDLNTISTTLKNILEVDKKLFTIKDQIAFIKSLFSRLDDEAKLKTINKALDNISMSEGSMNEFRNILMPNYISGNNASMIKDIANYINDYLKNHPSVQIIGA